MAPRKCRNPSWALPLLFALIACGGGDPAVSPSVEIRNPTESPVFSTDSTEVRLGGSIAHAGFVHVVNETTGAAVEGYVNYLEGSGSWFADMYGLVPGDNFIVVTADSDGTGARIATDAITVTRPLRPAARIINGPDRQSTTTCWADTHSIGGTHRLTLYADGTGLSTTGSVFTEAAGPAVNMTWSIVEPDVIVINDCADCSFQRIGRISGSTDDGGFYGQVETVGNLGETALHYFQLQISSAARRADRRQ